MSRQDEVIDKIKKALRLARKAGTDGERIAAENAARRLAENNGVSLDEIKVSDSDAKAKYEKLENRIRRHGVLSGFISTIIREHFGVVIVQEYAPRAKRMNLYFFGTKINIEVAKYVYEILWRETERAWKEAREELTRPRIGYGWMADFAKPPRREINKLKYSFLRGWFAVIHDKLTKNPLRNDREQFAEEKKAAEKAFEKFKEQASVTQKQSKSKEVDVDALYGGMEKARRVNLSRPCEGSETVYPFALGM